MATMNNLAKKNILKINQSKKTYIYSVGLSRKELTKSIIQSVAEKLL
jgi:predicted transcriptional regulator